MSGWVRLEKFKVTERRGGAIYKTQSLGFKWFPIEDQPECYVVREDDTLWVSTGEFKFQKDRPMN